MPQSLMMSASSGSGVVLAAVWFLFARKYFSGPPVGVISVQRQCEIDMADEAVRQPHLPHETSQGIARGGGDG